MIPLLLRWTVTSDEGGLGEVGTDSKRGILTVCIFKVSPALTEALLSLLFSGESVSEAHHWWRKGGNYQDCLHFAMRQSRGTCQCEGLRNSKWGSLKLLNSFYFG